MNLFFYFVRYTHIYRHTHIFLEYLNFIVYFIKFFTVQCIASIYYKII